jgi:hypothetical protein
MTLMLMIQHFSQTGFALSSMWPTPSKVALVWHQTQRSKATMSTMAMLQAARIAAELKSLA